MDIPLSGALFITNPRRGPIPPMRENASRDTMIRRCLSGMTQKQRSALAKKAGIGRLAPTLAAIKALKKRNYAAYEKVFKLCGGQAALDERRKTEPARRKAFKKLISKTSKRGRARTKSKTTKRKNPPMMHNPANTWTKFRSAAAGKGWAPFELAASYKTLVKKHTKNGKLNKRALYAAAKALPVKGGAKKAAAKRKPAKRKAAKKTASAAPARLGFSLRSVVRVLRKKDKRGRYGYYVVLRRAPEVTKRISKAVYDHIRAQGIGARGRTLRASSRRRAAAPKAAVKAARPRATRASQAVSRSSSKRKLGGVMAGISKSRSLKALKMRRGKNGRITYHGYRNGRYGLISKAEYERRKNLHQSVYAKEGKEGIEKLLANPFGALALRKNGRRGARRNPLLLDALTATSDAVSRVPVVGGFFGPKIPALGLGLAVGAVHFFAMRYLGPKLPELGQSIGGMLGKEDAGFTAGRSLQTVGYSLGGIAVTTLLQAGRMYAPNMFPAQTVNALSFMALGTGVALDFVDYMRGDSSSEAAQDAAFTGDDMLGMDDMFGEGDLSGLAYTGGQLNGLAYTGGQLNGVAYTGGQLNGVHMNSVSSLDQAYGAAMMSDADYSGPDFDVVEGQAFILGPNAFADKFGQPSVRGIMNRSGHSALAGKPGHRWAWLVKLIGWRRTAQLAAMAPQKRMKIIARLRARAKAMVDSASRYNGLAYTGGNLNGLAYTGGQLNGLAYTGGRL